MKAIITAGVVTLSCLALAGIAHAEQCANPKVAKADLKASFSCNMDLANAQRSPVLLVPGTTLKPDENFDWNYIPALDERGWPVCTVEVPESSMGDIQTSARHIAHAIREAYRLSGHKVQVIGFSQGGMSPRWALRFFPDTRQKVDDMISLSGSHHGAVGADFLCLAAPSPDPDGNVGCEAALWQQATQSAFISQLNEGYETVEEVDYTAIYTVFDDVLPTNGGPQPTSELRGGGANVSNITLQDLCPANLANHTDIGTSDPVGYAIALDALEHQGPASLERLLDGGVPGSSPVCAETFMPGVNPLTYIDNLIRYFTASGNAIANSLHISAEPASACYSGGNGPGS